MLSSLEVRGQCFLLPSLRNFGRFVPSYLVWSTKKNITPIFPFFSSLTLEGVRRTLEKDMDLKINSLDPHKKFIKQCVDKV